MPRMARKAKVLQFPSGKRVRGVPNGVRPTKPERRLAEAIAEMIERDGAERVFHALADMADSLRRGLAKAATARSSG
jgi:hypothetical protein